MRPSRPTRRSEEHTSELQSRFDLVCRLLLENKNHTAPGRVLVKAKYSKIKLRFVAQVTKDPVLVCAYAEGADVHLRTAAAVFFLHEAQVTRDQHSFPTRRSSD